MSFSARLTIQAREQTFFYFAQEIFYCGFLKRRCAESKHQRLHIQLAEAETLPERVHCEKRHLKQAICHLLLPSHRLIAEERL